MHPNRFQGLYSRHVNVNIGFTRIQRAIRRDREVRSVNQCRDRVGTLRDPWRILLVEQIEVRFGKVITLLVETERVAPSGLGGIGNIIHSLDAGRGHVQATAPQVRRKEHGLFRDGIVAINGRSSLRVWLGMSQVRFSLCLGVFLDNGGKFDSRRDVVDMALDVLWDMVPGFVSVEPPISVSEQGCLTCHIQS